MKIGNVAQLSLPECHYLETPCNTIQHSKNSIGGEIY